MSLFSFIAFPRECDTSCLKSRYDKSKSVKMKDLKGTKWENDYIGCPDDAIVYLGDPGDSHELQIGEKDSWFSKYEKAFDNPFIYSLGAMFIPPKPITQSVSLEEILDIIEEYDGVRMSKEEYIRESEEYGKVMKHQHIEHVARCRKQLYDLVKFNTEPGETVEIYSYWVSGSGAVKLRAPKEKIVLHVEDVLTSELLDLRDRRKIEIQT